MVLLAGALAATFGAFFLTAARVTTRAREVRVPDVRAHSLAEATAILADAGLVLRVDLRRPDPSVPAEHVMAQDPAPGAVLRRQRAVRVRVSEGQRSPVIPSVVGQLERAAELQLSEEKIDIASRAEIRTASYPAGTVVAQDPVAAQQAAQVALLVNRGETGVSFVMPDLIGTLGGRVVDLLRRRGFRVTIAAEVPYPGLPPGVIVRQTPQAGFEIGYGDAVLVEISR